MSEEKVKNKSSNGNGSFKNAIFKIGIKFLKILAIGLIVFFILVGSIYVIQKDDLESVSAKSNSVKSTVNSKGETVYVTNNEADGKGDAGGAGSQSGASGSGDVDGEVQEPAEPEEVPIDEIAELLHEDLDEYIDASDEEGIKKVKYLLQAETITKTPYIESAEPETAGKIKFYRFNGEDKATVNEANRITYVTPEEYEDLKQKYTNSGDETIFKHFTLGDEGSLKIAYGTKETKNITSKNGDVDLTEEIIRQKSGDELYTGNYKDGFTITRYTIRETTIDYKPLVEQYAIPSNLLFSLLIQTRDIRFVEDIAKLAYETELAIGIYDNESVSYVDETYTYQKMLDTTISTYLSFNFSNITNPTITNSTISNLKVPYRCHTYLNKEKQEHKVIYKKGSAESRELDTGCLYIKNVTEDAITETSAKDKAKTFELKYRKDITAKSSPTVGLILADTWIAKWSATYTKEENPSGPIDNSNTLEDEVIETYDSKESFLNAFNDKTKNDFSDKLNSHAEELKKDAIEVIYEDQKGNISLKKVTVSELTQDEKTALINEHRDVCTDCDTKIEEKIEWFILHNQSRTLIQIVNSLGGKVKEHYLEAVEAEMQKRENEANKQDTQNKTKKEKEFKEALEKEGTITPKQDITAHKCNVNIEFTSSTGRTSTTYKKDETVQRDDDGKKFSEIFNNKDYYKATQALKARIAWFWEYMEKNEDTERLIYVFKYLLNIATDSNDYGTFTEEEINKLFEAFEPQKMNSATIQGIKLLKEYIRSWENAVLLNYINGDSGYSSEVAKYINEEKTEYYIRDDGAGNPTVGFGIDIFNGNFVSEFLELGYTIEQLKDISGAVSVSVEFVDSLEEERIQNNLASVREQTADLQLKNYQLYALVSRVYNCGLNGAINGYTGIDFISAYNKYFNPETDLKYGEREGDFHHKLYTEFMDSPTKSDGVELAGLVRRRKSEWTLFQTGYIDTLQMFVSSGNLLTVADEVHRNQITWVYYTDHPKGAGSLYWNNIESSINNPNESTCCATYVATVLYQAGYATEEELNAINYNVCIDVYHLLEKKGWTKITSKEELEPGDIVFMSKEICTNDLWAHTQIYAGDNTWYNAGATSAIQKESPYSQGNWTNTWVDWIALRPN